MQSILAYSPSYFTIASLYQTHIIIATIRCNVTEIRFLLMLYTQLNKVQSMVVLLLDFSGWMILCRNNCTINFSNENCSKFHYNIDINYIKSCVVFILEYIFLSLTASKYKQYFQKWLFNIRIMCDGYEYEVIWLMMKCDTSFSCMIGTESWETWRNDKPAEFIDDSNIQYFV